jgi:hypothetical protein
MYAFSSVGNQDYNQQNSVLVIVTLSKVEIPIPLGPLPMVIDYKVQVWFEYSCKEIRDTVNSCLRVRILSEKLIK